MVMDTTWRHYTLSQLGVEFFHFPLAEHSLLLTPCSTYPSLQLYSATCPVLVATTLTLPFDSGNGLLQNSVTRYS